MISFFVLIRDLTYRILNCGLWYRCPETGGSMLVLYSIDLSLHTEVVSKRRETVVRALVCLEVRARQTVSLGIVYIGAAFAVRSAADWTGVTVPRCALRAHPAVGSSA